MGEHLTETVTRLVLQLAVILFAAKLGAEVCERYLKIPAVLGELAVGIVIGPYALEAWRSSASGLFSRGGSGRRVKSKEGEGE